MYYLFDCVCLRVSGRIWISLSNILIFRQAIYKLATKELFSLVIRDIYWSWIPYQPSSFHQVHNRHCFLVGLLCYFKRPSYGVYHCDGFYDYRICTFSTYFVGAYKIYTYFIPWCFFHQIGRQFTVFFVDRFVRWHMSHLVTSFCKTSWMPVQYKCLQIIASV